jgi:GNAT superfamily N-acetyltransferase
MMYEGSKRISFYIWNPLKETKQKEKVGELHGMICMMRMHLQEWFQGDSSSDYRHYSDTLDLPIGVLFKVWVHPDRRRRGLAAKAIADFIQQCRDCGCSQVLLNADQTQGVGFDLVPGYESMGFKKIGRSNLGEFMLLAALDTNSHDLDTSAQRR